MRSMKLSIVVVLVALITTWACAEAAEVTRGRGRGRGHGGQCPVGQAAASLTPCLAATRNPRARVSPACCARVRALINSNPRCLCTVLLSPLARRARINPAVAIAIPKRCNIRNRPAGRRCGRYIVP